ncbi:hypothetical protein AB1Y20_007626 [Prymnesium parvum]|uniref:Hexosyltransferase n=1 Tax=Prymnesium parvum TaxID=97485 RepID=A0AB34IVS1_PRYPA
MSVPSTRLTLDECLHASGRVRRSSHCQTLRAAAELRGAWLRRVGATRRVGACLCREGATPHPPHLPALRCAASDLCASEEGSLRAAAAAAAAAGGAIVTVLANERAAQVRQILQLKRSLEHAGSALPFHVLMCGVRNLAFEASFANENITTHRVGAAAPPPWAHRTHRATFSKLAVWNASFAWNQTLLYLDTDTLVLRNVDHLLAVRTPAFVLRQRETINSGVMVLRVRHAYELDDLWRYFTRLLQNHTTRGDGGDQEVLINYFAERQLTVHELPVEYNAFAWEMDPREQWWRSVKVLHKMAHIHRLTPNQITLWQRVLPNQADSYLSTWARQASHLC